MNNKRLRGGIFIALGASSYGMLTTFVKMAYSQGYTTAEVTLSQFGLGFTGLLIMSFIRRQTPNKETKITDLKVILKLIGAGTSLGLTSICYYLSVQYVSVSVGIVLLMQTVWMGVILEMILHKKRPSLQKIIAVGVILAGTVLATDLYKQSNVISTMGLIWGLMAAVSYTATMYSSNNIGLGLSSLKRSLYMILGGLIIVTLVFHSSINQHFAYDIFPRWGIVLSLFGTILPPLLLTRGMPLTGMGLGAIIASLEIPVSVFMAYLLLKEPVSVLQWGGVVLILLSIVLMNSREENKSA